MLSGTFEMQKNSAEVTYWQNGEQSYCRNGEQFMIYYLCNVLSYVCELCFIVRNANGSLITSKCCGCTNPVRNIPSQIFLDLKSPMIVWMVSILVSSLSDKKGVTRSTQVWVLTDLCNLWFCLHF